MTSRERTELEGLVSAPTSAARIGLFLLAVWCAGWLSRILQRALLGEEVGGAAAMLWLLPTLTVAAFLYLKGRRWTGGREFRRRVRRDLARDEIALHRIRVVAALEAPEVEDEGPVFFVAESGGATLFFSGQEMARQKERGFPWTEFEVSESPESGHFFRLRPLGPPFEPVGTRRPLSFSEAKDLGVLSANYGRLDAGLDDLGIEG